MALKIQRLQLVLAILVAVQENVPATSGVMVSPPFRPPELGAARCIESHTFGRGVQTLELKQRCEGGCSGKKPEDGDKCVAGSEASGSVLIFLSGVCQNKTCKINNESEIYKQEMNVSLGSNGVSPIPQLPGCGFTSVQDKNRQASQNITESGNVRLTVGECRNGTCVSLNRTETVDVKKELVSNSD
uniref:Putative secreted protein n=1 Tax=Ixodes ricinus TaxID=34613 RepID=A0A0K8R8K9_IXORI